MLTIQDLAELKAMELADKIFVVVAERKKDGKTILIPDPGMGKPWSSRNKRLADDMATQIQKDPMCRKAAAMTISEAFPILQEQLRKDAEKN